MKGSGRFRGKGRFRGNARFRGKGRFKGMTDLMAGHVQEQGRFRSKT